ncbi:MAG: hypothetical protein WC959_09100 [Kiritimatiellales bacterium]
MKSRKMQKFEELAERRVNEVLKKINLIGNLSNTGNYEYTETHARQIIKALKDAVKEVENRFDHKGRTEKGGFKFKI